MTTTTQITDDTTTATIIEQGNGFPSAGDYVMTSDSQLYTVVSMGRIQTGDPRGNYVTAELEEYWGDDPGDDAISDCRVEIDSTTDYSGYVLVERMPDHLRASHRAARNWGDYPHNGAERVLMSADNAEYTEEDEYDHVVRDYSVGDEDKYTIAD